ncbi:MAG: tetratricopeptide repeat protein [Deltaproteobacteria bacterium]|nr:tetratricopeptide repeat protein [Deltaproteobacteria bacterium]
MRGLKRKKGKAESDSTQKNTRLAPVEMPIEQAMQLANGYRQAGQPQQAETIYQQILAKDPDNAQAYSMLGILAGQAGDMERAIQLTQKAIRIAPVTANFHYNLGIMFKQGGQFAEAIASYRKAVALQPDFDNALYNLGNVLQGDGQSDEAIACYRQVVAIRPGHAEACNNLGILLKEAGRFAEANSCYRQAISISPGFAEAYSNLGLLLQEMDQLDEAESCQRRAISLKPGLTDAHYNLGIVLNKKGQFDEAIKSYRQALALRPKAYEVLLSLGNSLNATGQLDEARACYQRVLAGSPTDHLAWTNFLLTAQYTPVPSPAALFQHALRFAEQFEAPLKKSWEPHANTAEPERRLKIGYVSADFRAHSVAYFIEPILAHHRKEHVEVFCYYNNKQQDDCSRRLAGYADHWLPCAGMSDEGLAQRIRADRIDILVDLAGHTNGNRLLVFARKPAPVQVTWLGYPDTTGLAAMDYRLTDNQADPAGNTEQWHSETLFRLPNCFLCYAPQTDCPEVAPPPVRETGMITFASFNNLTKVSEATIRVWATILRELPSSRLLLKSTQSSCESVRNRLWLLFAGLGVAQERIHFAAFTKSFTAHMGLYGSVDIGLDTFPYNGTTTTCEALWMGVPVIILAGARHVARVGVSLLSTIGLDECIAANEKEYVRRAVALAADHTRLTALRQTMRARVSASPLCDGPGFTRDLEGAYRAMWRTWCSSC